MAKKCPLCHVPLTPALDPEELERETARRGAFVHERVRHPLGPLEAMDLTRFMHGGPARILACRACGLLVRDEQPDGQYETDEYDPVLMKHLYPRYVKAFERKRPQYEPLLRPGAEVVEVGSHLGAFLETAEQWGWRPTGVDIGDATTAFARRQGVTVKHVALDDYRPRMKRPEGIFIWNCFEQLTDPVSLLRRCHELLDPTGLLVVRVPNAAFYLEQRQRVPAQGLLAYNNLLGFPYLHGYDRRALAGLLARQGFTTVDAWNSSLLTPPYPEISRRVRAEWRRARREGEKGGVEGPWLELVCRRRTATFVPAAA